MSTMQNPTPTPNAGPGSPRGNASRFTPVDPLRLLRQHWMALVGAAVAGVVLGIGLFFLLARVAPQYTAEATVTVQPEMGNPLTNPTGGGTGTSQALLERFQQTQALYMGSERTLSSVLNNREIRNTDWYQSFNGNVGEALEELKEMISVYPQRNSQVVVVSATTSDPALAADLANTLVDEYLQRLNQENLTERDDVQGLFTTRRNRLQAEIDRLQDNLSSILDESALPATRNNFSEVDLEFRNLLNARAEAFDELVVARQMQQSLKEKIESGTMEFSSQDEATIEQYPDVARLNAQINQTEKDRRATLERFGKEHRLAKELDRQLAALESVRDELMQEKLIQLQEVQLNQANNMVASAQARVSTLDQQLTQIRQKRGELNQKLANYDLLKEELDRKQQALTELDQALMNIEVARDHPGSVRVDRGDPAMRPDRLSFPTPVSTVAATTFLMVALVGGLVFLREMLDSRIKGPSCAKLLPSSELLGTIPDTEEDPSGADKIERIAARRPGGLLAESFRQLRTEVVGRMQRRRFKTLMVAGCQPGSGTTAVAGNLAISAAHNGRRILLVDANFRRPAVHKTFGLDAGPGLGDLLEGRAEPDAVVRPTEIENLDVITIGADGAEALERLESDRLTQALRQLEDRYDLILVDSPPLTVVSDSRVLADRLDAVLLVVRAMQEKRGMVSRVMGQLKDCRAELIGLALNGVRSSAGGYFRRNYQQFYEYQNGQGEKGGRSRRRRAAAGSEA